ncbi:MAG: transposase [Candidatus Jordarchaeaceae archaeon]
MYIGWPRMQHDPYEVDALTGPASLSGYQNAPPLGRERMGVCRVEPMHMLEVSSMQYVGIVVLYIGIDVHKKFCYVCIMDREGNIIKEFKVPNDSYGVRTLLGIVGGRRAKAVIESTGNFWIRIYTQLEEAGAEVVLSNPKKKAIAGAKIKNDKRNARTLAHLLRTNMITPCYVPPPKIRETRKKL